MNIKSLLPLALALSLILPACAVPSSEGSPISASATTISASATPISAPATSTKRPSTNPPASTPTVTPNPYIIDDNFDDPNTGWPSFGDKTTGEVGYSNGIFRFAFYQPGGFNASWSMLSFTDFVVETHFCTSPTTPAIGAGLTLRASKNQWYLFWILPATKEYTFMRATNVEGFDLIPLTHSNLIQPYTGQGGMLCLSLKAAARGDTFDFWVAGQDGKYQHLATAHDSKYQSGALGPSASSPRTTFSPSPVEALFDWIRVTNNWNAIKSDAGSVGTPIPDNPSCAPTVSVSMDTNCRTGPGVPYSPIGSLLVGESATIVGRNQFGDFWIIKNPDESGTCWLWDEYATVSGETSCLPVIVPPPSPTPEPVYHPYLSCVPSSVPYMGIFDVDGYNFQPGVAVYFRMIFDRPGTLYHSDKTTGPYYADANGFVPWIRSNCFNGTADKWDFIALVNGVEVSSCSVICQTP